MSVEKKYLTENYEPASGRDETILKGIGVSQGVAIGAAWLVQVERPRAPKLTLKDKDVEREQIRFDEAVQTAIDDIQVLKIRTSQLPEETGEEVSLLLDAHLAMLSKSRLIRGVRSRIEKKLINAEYAIEFEIKSLSAQFKALNDSYIAARIDDVQSVGIRLMRVLMDMPYLSLDSVPQGGIVLAEEITPADTALLDPRKFGGICTVHGGAAGHTAVMSRSLGLPAVLGVRALLRHVVHGDMTIIDGVSGRIILNPTIETYQKYQEKQHELQQEKESLQQLQKSPAITKDGVEVALRANIEMPRDLSVARDMGALGIGLFRTEFMFMNRDKLPSEDEQYGIIKEVIDNVDGEKVTFRTLDIGGDKLARSLGEHMSECDNPALGLRGIRLSLKETDLLKTQFRAILRAAFSDGRDGGNVRILLPLVTMAEEVRQARIVLQECAAELRQDGLQIPKNILPLGVMIEIPAAALAADSLAVVSDFFALGTNDLIQYTLAIDRGNDQVASLYNPLNPAVLRLMEFSVQAALRADISISICGEMAADPNYTALLIGMGIGELSVGAAAVPTIKKRIRDLNMIDAKQHAQLVMDQYESRRIKTLIDGFNQVE